MSALETIMPHEMNTLERAMELAEASEGSVVVPCRQLRVLVDNYQGRDAEIEGLQEEVSQLESEVEELRDKFQGDVDDEPVKTSPARAMVIPGKRAV